jgi:hypothetical protein
MRLTGKTCFYPFDSGLPTYSDQLASKILTIDVAELHKASSDSALLGSLARQTGYRPIFTFLDSANRMLDLASVGLIGQKGLFIS